MVDDGFRDDCGGSILSLMDHSRAGILILAVISNGNGDDAAFGTVAMKDAGWVFHSKGGTDIAVDPFHEAIFLDLGSLRDEVKDVGRPVLDGRVTDVGAF